ncbi:MAG: sugar phosphate isomerase/epimerase family protein [Solirubrobacteraceae bacterium]
MSCAPRLSEHLDIALHSYSCRLRFLHEPGYDVLAFLDDAAARGYTGVNLSLSGPDNDRLPPHRHLGGDSPEHLDAVTRRLAQHRLSVELDTDTVEPGRLAEALEIAGRLGARVLRTFTHHPYGPGLAAATERDLRAALPAAERTAVTIALENHEELTGPELAGIARRIDHPRMRLLFDYGNGLPVLERPEDAFEAMRPWVAACHVKDVVLVAAEHVPEGVPAAAGVPLGQGALDLAGLTRAVLATGLRRLCVQNVWGYHVPLGKLRPVDRADPRLGHGTFAYAHPPHDPARIAFDPEATLRAETCVTAERDALTATTEHARRLLGPAGAARSAISSSSRGA